jgi:hypothetical protein
MHTMTRRALLLVSAAVAALGWIAPSTNAAGPGERGVLVTRNGFLAPLYGMSQVRDANGDVFTACAAMDQPQVDAARFGRSVSRALEAMSPQAVVQGPEGGATFDVTYVDAEGTGFNDPATGASRRRAFEAALAAWGKVITAHVPIRVSASMKVMDDGDNNPATIQLGYAGPTEFWLIENKVVASALAWQILKARYDNARDSDITVEANTLADWDYSVNGEAPAGKASFVYTMMHELAHGLGFLDSFDIATGKVLNDPFPTPYDELVNRGSSQRNRVLDHAPDEAIRDLTSGDLFFNGESANHASQQAFRPLPMVKLHAPNPYRPGSRVSHVDQDTYADVRTGLMTPRSFGTSTDKIDKLTLAILEDMGYTLVPEAVTTRTR